MVLSLYSWTPINGGPEVVRSVWVRKGGVLAIVALLLVSVFFVFVQASPVTVFSEDFGDGESGVIYVPDKNYDSYSVSANGNLTITRTYGTSYAGTGTFNEKIAFSIYLAENTTITIYFEYYFGSDDVYASFSSLAVEMDDVQLWSTSSLTKQAWQNITIANVSATAGSHKIEIIWTVSVDSSADNKQRQVVFDNILVTYTPQESEGSTGNDTSNTCPTSGSSGTSESWFSWKWPWEESANDVTLKINVTGIVSPEVWVKIPKSWWFDKRVKAVYNSTSGLYEVEVPANTTVTVTVISSDSYIAKEVDVGSGKTVTIAWSLDSANKMGWWEKIKHKLGWWP